MAIALKFNSATGQLAQFVTADSLEVQSVEPRNTAAALVIGNTLASGQEVQLGNANADTRILGDLLVNGSSTVSTDETITGTFNAEGDVNLGTGDGDAINLGGGATDIVSLLSNLVVGAGLRSVGSSITDYLSGAWLQAVNDNGPDAAAYDLRASGTNAGAYSVGVDPSLIANSSSTDLMSMLDDLDAAIAAGSGTLQSAYEQGETITVTAAEGSIDFSNDTDSDVTDVLTVSRAPTTSTAGSGFVLTMGANTTGIGAIVEQGGSGDALRVQGGSGANPLNINPQAISANAGLSVDAAAGGGAGELTFDDVGNIGATLSQASDRTFDQTGTGEVLNGATSLVGAINRLARRLDVEGGNVEEIAIENGVTIAAGDVVAQSTVTGRVTQANNNANTNSRTIGVAVVGGTGDAGGTVVARVALPGSKVTDSGAAFTAGNALFVPDGSGRPTSTAPTDTGDVVQRVGWARSATEYVIDFGPAVIL